MSLEVIESITFGGRWWVSRNGRGDPCVPGEFGRAHMTFFGSWDRWQISRVQSLPGDTSVFVELDFCHGGDEKERRGKDGASNWAELVCLVNRLYRSFSIIARADRVIFEVNSILYKCFRWPSVFRPTCGGMCDQSVREYLVAQPMGD